MFVVIFTAKPIDLDQEYEQMAARMRELALSKYGCVEFVASISGDLEIALSYWNSLEEIAVWKQDLEHLQAQQLGRTKWYESYKVEIAEIQREYRRDNHCEP